MSELTDKLIDSDRNSKLELCILSVLDDAYSDGYGSKISSPALYEWAEQAAEELAALEAVVEAAKGLAKSLRHPVWSKFPEHESLETTLAKLDGEG